MPAHINYQEFAARNATLSRLAAQWHDGGVPLSQKTVSVIIPTIGRPSLARAVTSFARQRRPGDEILVVGPIGTDVPEGCRFIPCVSAQNWGATERTLGIAAATGDYLAFMDDDDIYLPNARQAMAESATVMPDLPVVFRMHTPEGVIWSEPVLKNGRVSSQLFFIPNVPSRLGKWSARRCGDYEFLKTCHWPKYRPIFRCGDSVVCGDLVFRPTVIAVLRPDACL